MGIYELLVTVYLGDLRLTMRICVSDMLSLVRFSRQHWILNSNYIYFNSQMGNS